MLRRCKLQIEGSEKGKERDADQGVRCASESQIFIFWEALNNPNSGMSLRLSNDWLQRY